MTALDRLYRTYAQHGPVSRGGADNVLSLAAWKAQSAAEVTYEDVDGAEYSEPHDADVGAEIERLTALVAMYERELKRAGRMYNGRPVMTVAEAALELGRNRSSVARRLQPTSRNRIEGVKADNGQWWVFADTLTAAKRGRPHKSAQNRAH